MPQQMKGKKINMNKYKCSGVLYELLVRQITSDILANKPLSEATNIMRKYFNPTTELGKEIQLYRIFFEEKPLTESKAIHFIDLILEQRKKLDEKKLAREKYQLVNEIKKHYPLKEFLSNKIPDYTVHASIYKTFSSECDNRFDAIANIAEVAQARFTLVEHLAGKTQTKSQKSDSAQLQEFLNQTEELRMISYKLLVEKFNEKYENLNEKQKNLLREFINNVPTTNSLYQYVQKELPILNRQLTDSVKKVKDKILQIKLNEVASQLPNLGKKKTIRDNEVAALMIAYELLKEINVQV